MRAWALDLTRRLEAERDAVVALVENRPARRVTVIVEDPAAVGNGFAIPLIDAPTIFLWPTPPGPADDIGDFRIWGELLSSHEFAHIAHLTRPSRNPWQRTIWRLLSVDLGPIARRSPRWLYEGYATYVEGKVTGSGRPNSVARAAVLSEFALEGKLPTYAQLDGTRGYEGGAMAYLAGSAFLEWLIARSGAESLPHLWRRMTARADRGFVDAFAGVFGGPPDELYGRFSAELTFSALTFARSLRASGVDTGQTVQRLASYTGAPAISRDGRLLAITLRSEDRPARVVVWHTGRGPEDSAAAAARRRLIERDSEDVAAVPFAPAPKVPVATLVAADGRPYDSPRFLADGRQLLVIRDEPLADGALRPDLFLWDRTTGHVRRITHGAGIQSADPTPDGRAAIGIRCDAGLCGLVRIDLATGRIRVLLPGTPTLQYYRPRVAPDGRSVVVSVHDSTAPSGHWRLEDASLDSLAVGRSLTRAIGPDDGANRYQAAFLPSGDSVVAVSDAGGMLHIDVIDLTTGVARAIAASVGGLSAPEPSPSDTSVYFLSVYAKGRTLNQVNLLRAGAEEPPPALRLPLMGEAPVRLLSDSSTQEAAPRVAPYGIGPRAFRLLPGGAIAADGRYATLALANTDPVARLGVTLQGALGDPGTWRGAALAGAWRGLPELDGRLTLDGSVFAIAQHPSRESAGSFVATTFGARALDADYRGAELSIDNARSLSWGADVARLGASAGSLALDDGPGRARTLGFVAYAADDYFARGDAYVDGRLRADGALGETEGTGWRRVRAGLSIGAGTQLFGIRAGITGGVVGRDAPAFEQFAAGGGEAPLTDSLLLSQRFSSPALPLGIAGGPALLDYRIATDGEGPLLYYEGLSAGSSIRTWHRLVGLDWRTAVPSLGFVRLPTAFLSAGAAYSLSVPYKYKLRGYIGVRYAP